MKVAVCTMLLVGVISGCKDETSDKSDATSTSNSTSEGGSQDSGEAAGEEDECDLSIPSGEWYPSEYVDAYCAVAVECNSFYATMEECKDAISCTFHPDNTGWCGEGPEYADIVECLNTELNECDRNNPDYSEVPCISYDWYVDGC